MSGNNICELLISVSNEFLFIILTGLLIKGIKKLPEGKKIIRATLARIRVILSLLSIFLYTGIVQPIVVGFILNKKKKDNINTIK